MMPVTSTPAIAKATANPCPAAALSAMEALRHEAHDKLILTVANDARVGHHSGRGWQRGVPQARDVRGLQATGAVLVVILEATCRVVPKFVIKWCQ
jgi:hypothetical protein